MGGTGRPRGRPKRTSPLKPATNKLRGRSSARGAGRPKSSPSEAPQKRGTPKHLHIDEPSSDNDGDSRASPVVDGRKRRLRAAADNGSKPSTSASVVVPRDDDAESDDTSDGRPSFSIVSWNVLADAYCSPRSHRCLPEKTQRHVFNRNQRQQPLITFGYIR